MIVNIPLKNKNKDVIAFAYVDYDDWERVSKHGWYLDKQYAAAKIRGKRVYLHKFILGIDDKRIVDHINHDKLDCRKSNLRVATRGQNEANKGLLKNNTSGYKGVSYHKRDKKWRAQIGFEGKKIYLGAYNTPEEAFAAYAEASLLYFGQFACVFKNDEVQCEV